VSTLKRRRQARQAETPKAILGSLEQAEPQLEQLQSPGHYGVHGQHRQDHCQRQGAPDAAGVHHREGEIFFDDIWGISPQVFGQPLISLVIIWRLKIIVICD